jgi:hypothetical protein
VVLSSLHFVKITLFAGKKPLAATVWRPCDPPDPTAIAYLLRRGERLILEVRMSSLDHACNAVDLVTAAVSTVRFVEHSVFVEDLIDRCASTHGVDLTEHVVEIAKQ